VQSIEREKLREFAAQLSDVDLTELGLLARETVAAQPQHERVERLNEVIDLFIQELWDRLQMGLTRWRSKLERATAERVAMATLAEVMHSLDDDELARHLRATRAALFRAAGDPAQVRHRNVVKLCMGIMRARIDLRRMLSSLSRVNSGSGPKERPWRGEDG